ncbi:hypothetical protein KIPB_005065 [Kipferlia bialata]|uniref:Uncharacterized protein n=1 Tax=Kipferlia bialata TaxID=797122 RepID=A0A9K3CWP4_9EUKA|nr:hypothetical protein KIPB_005065 [Kipferlia bialata]|eukprot:g5065.t1
MHHEDMIVALWTREWAKTFVRRNVTTAVFDKSALRQGELRTQMQKEDLCASDTYGIDMTSSAGLLSSAGQTRLRAERFTYDYNKSKDAFLKQLCPDKKTPPVEILQLDQAMTRITMLVQILDRVDKAKRDRVEAHQVAMWFRRFLRDRKHMAFPETFPYSNSTGPTRDVRSAAPEKRQSEAPSFSLGPSRKRHNRYGNVDTTSVQDT